MKFPPFEYVRVATLDEAVRLLLAEEDARLIAGGQSLLPLMALRLARPTILVDITGLDLGHAEEAVTAEGTVLRLGTLVRHSRLSTDPVVERAAPLLAAAAAHIGHPAIRNRGTLGGSLAHADPAAELPAAAVALGATVAVEGPDGPRRLTCADLVTGYYSNSLKAGEIVIAVEVPAAGPGNGAAFCEWAARSGDFAEAGVGIAVETDADGMCRILRAAACGVAARPLSLSEHLAPIVVGAQEADASVLRAVAAAAESAARHAGASDDKAELAGLLTARSLHRAWKSSRPGTIGVAA